MKHITKRLISILIVITIVAMSTNMTSKVSFAADECNILDVYTDQASYTTTDSVNITVEIENLSTEAATKTLTTKIYHLESLIDTSSSSVSLDPLSTTSYTINWTPPSTDYQGYLVVADLGDGVEVTTAIDVSNDFSRYPRYGYSVDFPTDETSTESVSIIEEISKDYHINVVQYYDWMYRHDQNFPTTGDTWDDLFGNTISETTIQNRIDAGHDLNQQAMAYQMAYMVREDYEYYGADKEWGIYENKDYNIDYDPEDTSTISNIDQLNFPLEGDPGPILLAMNPANEDWQNFMIDEYEEAVDRLEFDGIQIDQMGEFWGSIDMFDYWGNYVDLGKTFSSFVNKAKDDLTTNDSDNNYVTMNIVNGAVPPNDEFSTWDIVNNADTDFQFSEIWGNSSTYDSLKSYIEWQRLTDGNKTMVLAAYMNQYENIGTVYEAESATMSGLSSDTDSDTTYVTGFDSTGDYVEFDMDIPEDGTYTLVFCFSNGETTRATKNIYVDDSEVMTANFDPTRTGLIPESPSWSEYSYEAAFTEPKTLYLTEGEHQIKLEHDSENSGDIRLDSVTLGTFDAASVRLTDSVIAASGAMHIEMGSGLSMANNSSSDYSDAVMLGHPYYPKAFKMMRDDLREEMKSHYDFITAYENLLYDPDILPGDGGLQNISIEDEDVTGSGEGGKIWFIPKTKGDDYGILHLINLVDETDTDWRDSTSEPTTLTDLDVTYYIPYNKTISNLYLASPDIDNCITESLSFTTGTDSVGTYINFTVPELKYWDMIYYELGAESEPTLYEAESSIKSEVSTNTNHSGYTGTGFVDDFGELYDSVTFDIEVDTEDDYTLEFTYANGTESECSRLLYVDNQDMGKISFQPLDDWDTWGQAEKGVHLLPGRHRLVILVTDDYDGYINLDSMKVELLSETVRSVYLNNWKDTVFLWKETEVNGAADLLSHGPGIYELRHYEETSDDDYSTNEIENYSMFFRDETDGNVYTTGSALRATGYFGEDGIFYSTYETYNGITLSPEIERSYAVLPSENFLIVKYNVKNTSSETKTINILDMLHVNNSSTENINATYSTTSTAITIDMSDSGQYYLAHGTLESSITSYQVANDTDLDTSSSTCSPWQTFNADGTLNNNASVTTQDVSTGFTQLLTLQEGEEEDLYFYIAIGETETEIQNVIERVNTESGDYWVSQMENEYSDWLSEGKTTSFENDALNDAYDAISVALKQSIVPGSYEDDGETVYKFAALPATTNPSAYSYKVWARDSAVTAMSLDATGHLDEAESYWYWLADRQIKTDEGDWKEPGTFWTCYWIWDNSSVSFVEPEYDSIGMFLVGAYRHYEALEETEKTEFLDNIWDAYKLSADFVVDNVESNGFGVADCSIWEESTEYNTFTQALYVAGLDAAQEMAKAKSLQELADSYNGAAGTIRSAIQRSSTDSTAGIWNESSRYYNRAVDTSESPVTTVDSSSDVLVTYGVVDMLSKRAYDHYEMITDTISHDTYGVTRYEGDTFYTGENSWDPGGVEAFEAEPSWPQMSMWVAMMEIYSGYDALMDNALRRLEWFTDRTALGYAPQGEAVSNVTLKPCISTMIEPITGAAYLMAALTYEDQFDMRITPNQYNAGAYSSIDVSDGCVDTSTEYDSAADWSQWSYIPYYQDEIDDNTAGDSTRDIEKIYICNDSDNIYIRVDNVGNTLPGYAESDDSFMMVVYTEDFAGDTVNETSNSFCGVSMDREMSYMFARWSDSANYSKFTVDDNGDWEWSNNITSETAPQWETGSGRFEMIIPISETSTSTVEEDDWANLKIGIGLDTGSGMEEVDFMNIHYRITGSEDAWLFGDSEQ